MQAPGRVRVLVWHVWKASVLMTSEQEVHAALRAWHSKMGYSHMERIRAALVAAEEVRSETDYFTPGDHVEVRATGERGTVNRIHPVTAEVQVEFGSSLGCRTVLRFEDPNGIRKLSDPIGGA